MTDHNLVTQRSEVLRASSSSYNKTILILVEEFAKLSQYNKKLLKESTSVNAFPKSDKASFKCHQSYDR